MNLWYWTHPGQRMYRFSKCTTVLRHSSSNNECTVSVWCSRGPMSLRCECSRELLEGVAYNLEKHRDGKEREIERERTPPSTAVFLFVSHSEVPSLPYSWVKQLFQSQIPTICSSFSAISSFHLLRYFKDTPHNKPHFFSTLALADGHTALTVGGQVEEPRMARTLDKLQVSMFRCANWFLSLSARGELEWDGGSC